MNAIVFLVLAVLPIVGFVVGVKLSQRRGERLSRPERQELKSLRSLKDRLTSLAIEHAAWDAPLSTIVLDEIHKTNRELERGSE